MGGHEQPQGEGEGLGPMKGDNHHFRGHVGNCKGEEEGTTQDMGGTLERSRKMRTQVSSKRDSVTTPKSTEQ